MLETKQAKEPFAFFTRLHLAELTGLRAVTLSQLSSLIKKVPGSCIYHHTHRFLQVYTDLSQESPNDFVYWVSEILDEVDLGERLAGIDIMEYSTIRSLRDKIADVIDEYLEENPLSKLRFARAGEEFHFIKSVSFVLPTNYVANNLTEFVEILKKVTIDSIYFHIFESRLRLEKPTNDFSSWIDTSIGDKELADRIARLDPYSRTLEDLRKIIIWVIEKRMGVL